MRTADRSRRIARPQPLMEWLTAADFQTALNAARVDATPSAEAMQSAITESREAIEAAQRAIHIPDGSSLLRVVADLKAIAKANEASRGRVIAALSGPIDQQEPRSSLTRRLQASDVTLIVALVDAASAETGTANAAAALADALLDNDAVRLGAWAEAAAAQYLAGAMRMPAAPTKEERRVIAGRLGHILIGTYAVLSGQGIAISRVKPEVQDAGAPSGPLVRYLSTLYRCLHSRLNAHGFTRHLAGDRLWSPTQETLVSWVRSYRSAATTPPR